MTMALTRRAAFKAGAGGVLAALVCRPFAALADDSVETHGLSSFGDLALPPDFPHFAYVNPDAPTGGLLSLQITGSLMKHHQNKFGESYAPVPKDPY